MEEAKALLEENGWSLFGDWWASTEDGSEEMYNRNYAHCENDAHEGMDFMFDENGAISEISWYWNSEGYYW